VGSVLSMFGLTEERPAFGYFLRNTNLTKIVVGKNVGSTYVDSKDKRHSTYLCMRIDLYCFVLLCTLGLTASFYGEQASCNHQVRMSSLFHV
jgi:hypothetical protein